MREAAGDSVRVRVDDKRELVEDLSQRDEELPEYVKDSQ
jgi:hypothetical protein